MPRHRKPARERAMRRQQRMPRLRPPRPPLPAADPPAPAAAPAASPPAPADNAVPVAELPSGGNSGKGGSGQIEEVLVTAQRRQERLQDVPISISVFTDKQIANANISNPSDLARYTPSLS